MRQAITPESIIKFVEIMAKPMSEIERRQISQYLIRKNFKWYPLRYIALLTGMKSTMGVAYNISKVEKSKYLLEIADDLNFVINA